MHFISFCQALWLNSLLFLQLWILVASPSSMKQQQLTHPCLAIFCFVIRQMQSTVSGTCSVIRVLACFNSRWGITELARYNCQFTQHVTHSGYTSSCFTASTTDASISNFISIGSEEVEECWLESWLVREFNIEFEVMCLISHRKSRWWL